MEKENTNSGSVYVTVDEHLNPVHVSMKGTGEEGFLEFMLEDVEKALRGYILFWRENRLRVKRK